MTRKSIMILAAVLVLIVAGVVTVMAQDGDDDPTPFGSGMMGGGHHGMMSGGYGGGMMWDDDESSMMIAVAEALGLEQDAFYAALRDGQTLAEIATAQGVELQSVYDAMLKAAEEHMATRVAAGDITQAQADEHLTWMRENIAGMPMFSGEGFGPCMDHDGSFGMGRMGHGHGMRWNHS